MGLLFIISIVAALAFLYMLFCDLLRDQKKRFDRHRRVRDRIDRQ